MGNPFVHLDLACNDLAAAKKFYGKVFDWKFIDMPAMNWSGIDVGEGVGGGIGTKQSPDEPTAWVAYVGVDDVKATIAKAEKNGAKIVVPFMEIPGMGYLGVFVDPQGATIGVWQQGGAAPAAEAAPAKASKKSAKKAAKAEPAPAAAPPAAKPAKKSAKKAAKAAPPVAAAKPAKAAKAAPPAAKPAKKSAKKAAPAPAPAPAAKPAKKSAKKK